MTETIKLMQSHSSVRRFKEQEIPQEDLNEILSAAQMASSWKNFQSYSVILVRSQEKKDALFELVPQEAIRQSAAFLLFVGDLNRAEKGARLHTDTFQPQGVEGLHSLRSGRSPNHFSRCSLGWTEYLACGRKPWLWWSNHRFGALQIC